MKKLTILILILYASVIPKTLAQKIDSLKSSLINGKPDTNQANTLYKISWEAITMGEYDTAMYYAAQAQVLAEKLNFKKVIAESNNSIASIYYFQGNYTESLKHHFIALQIREQINNKKGIGSSLNNIGNIYFLQKNYSEALKYYNSALKIFNQIDYAKGISTSYGNIASVHYKKLSYEEALENYLLSIKKDEEINNKKGLANAINNIANIYSDMADALPNDSISKKEVLWIKSLDYYLKSLKLRSDIDDQFGIASSNINIGSLYIVLKKHNLAKQYLNDGLKLAVELDSKFEIQTGYMYLSKLNLIQNDYKNAYQNYKYSIIYRDSLYNEENTKKLVEAQMQFEFDKKEALTKAEQEKKEVIENQEKQRQKFILISTFIGFLLVLIFSIFIYNRFKITQEQNKIIQTQKLEVENQKKITEIQKQLVESKNHEITQSIEYAKKIQEALLPKEESFKDIFENSFIVFKPKDIVSGDYFWISEHHEKVFYATADCTGHGVPGGFMSMLGTALLNEIIDERKVKDCGEVLTLMREKLMQALKQSGDSESKDGMDMVLIRIDKKTLEMQYAAANNSLYIVSNKQSAIGKENCVLQTENCKLYELPCDKMPVGVYHSEVKPFQTFNYQLQKGDTIYTYTDGYADQFGGDKGKKYTYKRLREKLIAISEKQLAEQRMILESEFESWKGDVEQVDDICLIGVRV